MRMKIIGEDSQMECAERILPMARQLSQIQKKDLLDEGMSRKIRTHSFSERTT